MKARWCLLLCLGCSSSLPRPEFERFDARVTPGPEVYPDVPAVVLMDRGELLLTADVERRTPIGRLRRYLRIKVLREPGIALSRVEVPFDPGSSVFGFNAQVITPEGRVVPAALENLTETGHAPSGRRAKAIQLTDVTVGSVIEYTYDLYVDDLRFLPPWIFQGELPTVRSEFAVVVPPGYTVDLRYSRDGAFMDRPPERFEVPEGIRFSWSEAKLPALFPEEGRPDPALLAPRAHVIFLAAKIAGREFKGFSSWDEVGEWFLSRQPNWAELSSATVEEARRVAGDAPADERALKILEVLARDLPPEPGPTPPLWRARLVHPEVVLKEQRANPTSRGLLLVALLRAAGLPALPGLYANRDEDLLLPDLPTVYGLDGVAAVIPRANGALVLDPSELTISTDVPPPRLQGTRVITMSPEGSEVVLVGVSSPEASKSEIDCTLELDKRGDLFGTLRATLTGAEAGTLRAALREVPPEDYAQITSDFLRARGSGVPVDSVDIADLSALRRPLTLKGSVKVDQVVTGEGTEIYLPIGRILGAATGTIREVRRAPLKRGAPRQIEVKATLTLPEGWEAPTLPAPRTESWAGGQVQLNLRSETRRRIGFLRSAVERGGEVDKRAYAAFRHFLGQVKNAENEPFVIKRPATRQLEF